MSDEATNRDAQPGDDAPAGDEGLFSQLPRTRPGVRSPRRSGAERAQRPEKPAARAVKPGPPRSRPKPAPLPPPPPPPRRPPEPDLRGAEQGPDPRDDDF